MNKFFSVLLLGICFCFSLTAQTTVTIKDADLVGGQTYNWTNNNVYLLDGFVFLEDGGVLNIEAGTVIKGKETPTTGDNASALIIARGAKIFAEGTACNPVIFTSEIDDTNDPSDLTESDRGLWGGLLILGRARNTDNTPETAIEGIPAGDPRGLYGAANSQFIDDDNSGVLRYVSIRHGGAEIGAGNEINGLTLGAVGSGTTLEYIEVLSNLDDGIEFFGGTVNLKYASVSFCGDDGFDWDQGYAGKGQFWFTLQGSDDGDNGAEMDGAIPDGNTPFANPTVYNATYIGAGLGATAVNEHALLFRDGTAGTYGNSIFTDFRNFAIQVEDRAASVGVDSRQRMENGDLRLLNNLWWNFGAGSELNAGANGIIQATPDAEDASAQFLINHLVANNNQLVNPGIGGISRTADGGLDPRPGAVASQNLASYPADAFFTPVDYKGAFGGSLWLRGWTALEEYGYLAPTGVVTIKDADLVGGQTYTWTNDNVYLLDGFVFLEDGGVLNIEAGTVIKGKETPTTGDNASALIIARGAKIFAEGTACNPVIFTSEIDDTNDPSDLTESDRGLWGGLLILGRARNTDNTPETAIEGIPAGDPRGLYGAANSQFIDDDNSGVLRYVSIRHGGAEIGAGNEINGLTLGAVGSGTTLEYIEVLSNLDDGIEFFGGTVNLKYASVSFCGDDGFDWDQGYAGKGQFWFTLQGSDDGDNGAEMDGAIPDGNTPFANPTVYNATYIGAGLGATAVNEHALLFRDGTAGTYGNSIFTDFRNFAIQVEDRAASVGVDSRQRMENGDLRLLNNLWWNFGAGSELNAGANGIIQATPDAEDASAQFLINHLVANNNQLVNPGIGGISRTADGGLDPRPGAVASQNLASYPADAFFTPVDYKGAFCDAGTWLKNWTALSEYGYLNPSIPGITGACGSVSTTTVEQNGFLLQQSTPNPASEYAQVKFELTVAANVSLVLTNILGREVARPIDNKKMIAGEHQIDLNLGDLPSGLYFYSLRSGNTVLTKSLVIQH